MRTRRKWKWLEAGRVCLRSFWVENSLNFPGKKKSQSKTSEEWGLLQPTQWDRKRVFGNSLWLYWLDQYTKQAIKTRWIHLAVEIDSEKEGCDTVKEKYEGIYQKAQIYKRKTAEQNTCLAEPWRTVRYIRLFSSNLTIKPTQCSYWCISC